MSRETYNLQNSQVDAPTESGISPDTSSRDIGSEVFFKIKLVFFGYYDPISMVFDNKNKYFSG